MTPFPARVRLVVYFQFVLRSLFLIWVGILLYFMFWDSETEPTFVSFSHPRTHRIPKFDLDSVNSTAFCRFAGTWLKVSFSSCWVLKKTQAMKPGRAHVHVFLCFSRLSLVLVFDFHTLKVLAKDGNYMQNNIGENKSLHSPVMYTECEWNVNALCLYSSVTVQRIRTWIWKPICGGAVSNALWLSFIPPFLSYVAR